MSASDERYTHEWSLETAMDYFTDALKFAEESPECLSLQDAIYKSGMPYSTFYYLADTYKPLEKIKADIQQAIIRRVNRRAINEDANPTASIWRMKQLGERDKQELDHTTGGQPFQIKPYDFIKDDPDTSTR
jgi:hypothetical protein